MPTPLRPDGDGDRAAPETKFHPRECAQVTVNGVEVNAAPWIPSAARSGERTASARQRGCFLGRALSLTDSSKRDSVRCVLCPRTLLLSDLSREESPSISSVTARTYAYIVEVKIDMQCNCVLVVLQLKKQPSQSVMTILIKEPSACMKRSDMKSLFDICWSQLITLAESVFSFATH
jgi:hypothetical protein